MTQEQEVLWWWVCGRKRSCDGEYVDEGLAKVHENMGLLSIVERISSGEWFRLLVENKLKIILERLRVMLYRVSTECGQTQKCSLVPTVESHLGIWWDLLGVADSFCEGYLLSVSCSELSCLILFPIILERRFETGRSVLSCRNHLRVQ